MFDCAQEGRRPPWYWEVVAYFHFIPFFGVPIIFLAELWDSIDTSVLISVLEFSRIPGKFFGKNMGAKN